MGEILKWLGGLSEGDATAVTIGSLAGTVFTVVWSAVKAHRKQTATAMAKADKPTIPTAPLPSPDLVALADRMRAVEQEADLARLRWRYQASLEERQELRIELERLQNALTTERRINAELSGRIGQLETDLANALVQPDEEARTWPPTS